MIGITEINKLISKEVKISEVEVKKITMAFLEVTKQGLAAGEEVSFRGYFSLTRSRKEPEGVSKFCEKHNKLVDSYKKANKGKGISSFSGSEDWKDLMAKTKSCSNCKAQKQKIVKLSKLLPRVNCKFNKEALESASRVVAKKRG